MTSDSESSTVYLQKIYGDLFLALGKRITTAFPKPPASLSDSNYENVLMAEAYRAARAIDLFDCGIEARHTSWLFKRICAEMSYDRLFLGSNQLGDSGIFKLTKFPAFASLRELDLSSNTIADSRCQETQIITTPAIARSQL